MTANKAKRDGTSHNLVRPCLESYVSIEYLTIISSLLAGPGYRPAPVVGVMHHEIQSYEYKAFIHNHCGCSYDIRLHE
jgi:hypothetical protein